MERVTSYFHTLSAVAHSTQVTEATARMTQSLAQLRFHEGLRRRWENARAEAAVQEATAVSLLEGIRTHIDDVRILSMNDPSQKQPIGEALIRGIWQSQWNLASSFPPLNSRGPAHTPQPTPIPALIAGLHRDIASPAFTSGHIPAREVAIPRDPTQMETTVRTIRACQQGIVPAVCAAADLWARLRHHEVFTTASGAVGAGLSRWLLVTRGVDPTGVAVISAWHSLNPEQSLEGQAAWLAAQMSDNEGEQHAALAHWCSVFADAVTFGAHVGADIALHIQAGRLSS